MPARCPPGKIRNPESGRCVKRDGKIGRQILAAMREQRQRQQPSPPAAAAVAARPPITLPDDMVKEIWSFVPRRARNCGHFIKMLLARYNNNLQTISPLLRKQLQTYVSKTLRAFRDKLKSSHIISYFGIDYGVDLGLQTTAYPMMRRVKDAIAESTRTQDPVALLNLCKLVVAWKHEARQILQEWDRILTYAKDVVEGRPKRDDYMGSLWAPEVFPVRNINNFPRYELQEWCRVFTAALAKDMKRLAILQQPIDIK